ncbi:cobalamin-binding protein [Immundisolibacter sp.]|uniref:cobalamin-binding protein n=1 Tax=Immundisolibacter sp. TaxID=1934948 RepID=UPI0035692F66
MSDRHPRRIVCLTQETCETLYLLGEQHRIVGISGFTVRPPQARREKPKVSAYTSARLDRILALKPDLVLGFSDLQAPIAASLVQAGLAVHVFNQRSVAGILDMICVLGALVGGPVKAQMLIDQLQAGMDATLSAAARLPRRPRVYFEEWDQPLISGIGWVSELIHLAGGEDCFAELGNRAAAQDRVIVDPSEVVRRAPDIIFGSWCGKRFRPRHLADRPGWDAIPALHNGQVFEIKSADILSPGPAALDAGLRQLHQHIAACARALP